MIFYFLSICTIYAQNVNDIFTDIENSFVLGYRPISQGIEAYINSQGLFIATFSETDFAIYGEGFFVLLNNRNEKLYLTRNGAFHFNDEGYLVNHENFKILSSRSNITRNEFIFISKNEYIDRDSFLLVIPIINDFIEVVDAEYLELGEFIMSFDNDIVWNALESMPVPLNKLFDDLVYYFYNTNISLDEKIKKFEILNNKFYILFRNNYLAVKILYEISLIIKEIEYILTFTGNAYGADTSLSEILR